MRWNLEIGTLFTPIKGFLLPQNCLLCGGGTGSDALLCAPCRDALPRIASACRQCGLPLPTPQDQCGRCLKKPPHYTTSTIPFLYAQPLDQLIKGFKFNGRLNAGFVLAEQLAETICNRPAALPELIVPVPLHASRLRERGFNQSLELARVLSMRLGIPVALEGCRRLRPTAVQSHLHARERRRNVRGAFAVHKLPGVRHVALVDDVVTTGNTVNELARVLKRAGVEHIEVWAVARAPNHK